MKQFTIFLCGQPIRYIPEDTEGCDFQLQDCLSLPALYYFFVLRHSSDVLQSEEIAFLQQYEAEIAANEKYLSTPLNPAYLVFKPSVIPKIGSGYFPYVTQLFNQALDDNSERDVALNKRVFNPDKPISYLNKCLDPFCSLCGLQDHPEGPVIAFKRQIKALIQQPFSGDRYNFASLASGFLGWEFEYLIEYLLPHQGRTLRELNLYFFDPLYSAYIDCTLHKTKPLGKEAYVNYHLVKRCVQELLDRLATHMAHSGYSINTINIHLFASAQELQHSSEVVFDVAFAQDIWQSGKATPSAGYNTDTVVNDFSYLAQQSRTGGLLLSKDDAAFPGQMFCQIVHYAPLSMAVNTRRQFDTVSQNTYFKRSISSHLSSPTS